MSFISIIDGSLGGSSGNTGAIVVKLAEILDAAGHKGAAFFLADKMIEVANLPDSDAFIFTTGTYWDGWGSPLQRFLELATPTELKTPWLGKPAGIVVTGHSEGSKGILSRLMGVLNTFGMFVPPLCGMTYTLAASCAAKHAIEWKDDFWVLDDLEVLIYNLELASHIKANWKTWNVDLDPGKLWIK
jgi:multimeric flavodoxin WrbA